MDRCIAQRSGGQFTRIWTSCHIAVTSWLKRRPEVSSQNPPGMGAEDEYETWNYRSAFTLRAGHCRVFHRERVGGIEREALSFHDASRDNRLVAVDIAVRRDKEMQADAGMITLPVAVLNHGNTVKNTECYLVISPQHDLPTDPPMVTKPGELYVGRLPQILRGVANIHFAVDEMKKVAAQRRLRQAHHDRAFDGRRHHDVFRQAVSRRDQEGRDAG